MALPTPEELDVLNAEDRGLYEYILKNQGEDAAQQAFNEITGVVPEVEEPALLTPPPTQELTIEQQQRLSDLGVKMPPAPVGERGIGEETTPAPVGFEELSRLRREGLMQQREQQRFVTPEELTEQQQQLYDQAYKYAIQQKNLPTRRTTSVDGVAILGLRDQAIKAFEEEGGVKLTDAPPDDPSEALNWMETFRAREKFIDDFIGDQQTAEDYAFASAFSESPRQARPGGYQPQPPIIPPSKDVDLLRRPESAKGLGISALGEALKPQIVVPGPEVRQIRAQQQQNRQDILEGIQSTGLSNKDYFDRLKEARLQQIRSEMVSQTKRLEGRDRLTPEEETAAETSANLLMVELVKQTFPPGLDAEPNNELSRAQLTEYYLGEDTAPAYAKQQIADLLFSVMTDAPPTQIKAEMIEAGLIQDPDAITESQIGNVARNAAGLMRSLTKPVMDSLDIADYYVAETQRGIINFFDTVGELLTSDYYQSQREYQDIVYAPDAEQREEPAERIPLGLGLTPVGFFILGGREKPEEEESVFEMAPFGTRAPSTADLSYIEELAVEIATGRGLGNDVVAMKKFSGGTPEAELAQFAAGTVAELFVPFTGALSLLQPAKGAKMAMNAKGMRDAIAIVDETAKTGGNFPIITGKATQEVREAAKATGDYRNVFADFVADQVVAAKAMEMGIDSTKLSVTQARAAQRIKDSGKTPTQFLDELVKNPYYKTALDGYEAGRSKAPLEYGMTSMEGFVQGYDEALKAVAARLADEMPDDYILLTPNTIVTRSWMDNHFDELADIMRRYQEQFTFDPNTGFYKKTKQEPLEGILVPPDGRQVGQMITAKEMGVAIESIMEDFANRTGTAARITDVKPTTFRVAGTPPSRRAAMGPREVVNFAKEVIESGQQKITSAYNKTFKGRQPTFNEPPPSAKIRIEQYEILNNDAQGGLTRSLPEAYSRVAKDSGKDASGVISEVTAMSVGGMSLSDIATSTRTAQQTRMQLASNLGPASYKQIMKAYFGNNANILGKAKFDEAFDKASVGLSYSFDVRELENLSEAMKRLQPALAGDEAASFQQLLIGYTIDIQRTAATREALEETYKGAFAGGKSRFYSYSEFDEGWIGGSAISEDEAFNRLNKLTLDYAAELITAGRQQATPDEWFKFLDKKTGKVSEIDTLMSVKLNGEEVARLTRTETGLYQNPQNAADYAEALSNFVFRIEGGFAVVPPGFKGIPQIQAAYSSPEGLAALDQALKVPRAAQILQRAMTSLEGAARGSWVQGQLAGKFVPNFGYQVTNTVSQPLMTYITSPGYTVVAAGRSIAPLASRTELRVAASLYPDAPSPAIGYNNRQLFELVSVNNLGTTGDQVLLSFQIGNDVEAAAAGLNPIIDSLGPGKLGLSTDVAKRFLMDAAEPFIAPKTAAGMKTSPSSQLARTVDYSVREGVFIAALNDGLSPAMAARLAREAQFDYGAMPSWLKEKLGGYALYTSFTYVLAEEMIKAAARPNGALNISALASFHTQMSNVFSEYKGEDDQLFAKTFLYPAYFDDQQAQPINAYWNDPWVSGLGLYGDILIRSAAGFDDPNRIPELVSQGVVKAMENLYIPVLQYSAELRDFDYKKRVPDRQIEKLRLIEQAIGKGTMMDLFDLEEVPLEKVKPEGARYKGYLQYRFKSQSGYNKFVAFQLAGLAIGTNRIANDLTGAFIAAGDLPEGAHFEKLTQDIKTYPYSFNEPYVRGGLYLIVGERAIRATGVERAQKQLRDTQRYLKDLEAQMK